MLFKIIQKSVLVSLFDKLKFKNMLENLTSYEKRYTKYRDFMNFYMEIKKMVLME